MLVVTGKLTSSSVYLPSTVPAAHMITAPSTRTPATNSGCRICHGAAGLSANTIR